jgi:Primase C terminal 2 (PriCT-2)/Family of unknown function (DUF5906)
MSGFDNVTIADAPDWLTELVTAPPAKKKPAASGGGAADAEPETAADLILIRHALQAIPNTADVGWDDWNRIALATFAATNGDDAGLELFDEWSAKHPSYDQDATIERWKKIATSPPTDITVLSLYYLANEATPGWRGVSVDTFYAYLPQHNYLFVPTREPWPAAAVDSKIGKIEVGIGADGKPIKVQAHAWLDRHRSVEQMIWAPGKPLLIKNRLISNGGWIARADVSCFNLYRPPEIEPGDARKAWPWLRHVWKVFGADDARHIIQWLAHRVQHPSDKINHALVLGGAPGIGKDTLLEPVKRAVGPWNFSEVSPLQMLGRFNGYAKSVILRISEARDLGDFDRFKFYDHMKTYTAAPPDVLRVDEKYLREHYVFNCCGVIITSNHKTDGIHLPADDRRHFVAWSRLEITDFKAGYWNEIHSWISNGGDRHVATYLAQLDISGWDAKAPPPKTEAFWQIVNANNPPEDAEMADAIDSLGTRDSNNVVTLPDALTLSQIKGTSDLTGDLDSWLRDRRNIRAIPHRLEKCGYVPFRNPDSKDGFWLVKKHRQVVYVRSLMSFQDKLAAVRALVRNLDPPRPGP